jgi:uncharacterized protein YPO0396
VIKHERAINIYQSIAPAVPLIKEIDSANEEIKNITRQIFALNEYIRKLEQHEKAASWKAPTEKAKKLMNEIDAALKEIEKDEEIIENLTVYIENIDFETYNMKDARKKEAELKTLLPDVCPLCGSKL